MVAFHGLKTPTAVAEFLVDQLLGFEFSLNAFYDRLSYSVKQIVQEKSGKLDQFGNTLGHLTHSLLHQRREYLGIKSELLRREVRTQLSRMGDHLSLLEKRSELMDPENILKRGYSITLLDGRIVSDLKKVKAGAQLETRVQEGTIISEVKKTTQKNGKGKN
jgi:exodeoxyribonuclease VII large subunit